MKLELTIEQINSVLSALAQRPYGEVQGLIQTIQTQATAQLEESKNE